MNVNHTQHRSIVLAGGGTAGHVNPLLATADAISRNDSAAAVTIVGTEKGLEQELVPAAGFELRTIERVPFPRRPNMAALKFFFRFRKAVKQAGEILAQVQADTVVGFGGYVSTPVYAAAKKRNLKIVVHEGNALPGMANKFGARMANTVALSFKNTPLRAKHGETVVTGLPLRKQISELALMKKNPQIRNQNAQKYGLDSDLPILVVTGGSLGAQHINEVVAQCAQEILDSGFQVLHICGKGKIDEVQAQTAQVRGTYQVLEYAANIDEIYSFADLVITRAGAGMVCEVSALGIPAVFVPLAVGNGEQALNAKDLVEAGGAILIPDNEFNTDVLREKVLPLLALEKLTAMASKARAAARIDAAAQLAAVILQ